MARRSVDDFVVDFGKMEETSGGGIRVPEATYPVKITAAKPERSSKQGSLNLHVIFTITEGKHKGKKIPDHLYTSPKALQRLRDLLQAVGKRTPKGRVDLAKIANAIKGEELYIEVVDEERDGYKTRSRVAFNGFMSVEDYEEQEDDGDDELDDEGDDELDDELEDEDDEEEDDEEEDDEPEPPKRRTRSKSKKSKSKKRQQDDDDEDDDDDLDLEDF